ncbi:hypothetical protein CYLTODRAFT_416242 [Cylindrobasidium torrendii FP15055 ss-10]|uniref:Transcription activator of gluconeogenesis ERT1 n=1 Tax=Cylindrobasidium torrendii FP15055 ss-10 TaxID=1314674 RepID=A0A0D7BVF3_9AGAR|nr:hypothetical protein CYLTODRAFT_416242 [Cylindrobasidium torrendii FP15055 ss-10]
MAVAPAFVNPAAIDNGFDHRPSKRKRADGVEDDQHDVPPVRNGSLKKKKATRACQHCQRAHLTCQTARPCERCIKRGIADTCTDGVRKKAKYLLDEEELSQKTAQKPSPPASQPQLQQAPPPPPPPPSEPAPIDPIPDPMFTPSYDPNFPFGSEAANLEYSILSAILGNPSPPDSNNTPPPDFWPPSLSINPPFLTYPYQEQSQADLQKHSADTVQPDLSEVSRDTDTEDFVNDTLHPLQPRYPLDARARSPTLFGDVLNDALDPSPKSSLQSINDRVHAPYDYTEGYHFLMKHLPSRFEKNDILRIVRALAIFRPSLIALQMPLSVDDEIFVEKCFQRSLLELDKLMSFSGTPTVVWRRTGEICLVAPEFCMLTEWSMEDLLPADGRKKYIYELFENQSVVEYWENFASHAFENSTQSIYSHCVLLKPNGAPVPSTFCFSIRRDLFDLPSAVIGQWLPLL